ncbi:hypothetical protein ACQPYA_30430 [Micromonospora sp. CA-263727]|uniref:hypothetical protein n=1 Tax=Micromonospora sp. CA-263727 TaxID=3239967 RepID=UPI003D8A3806
MVRLVRALVVVALVSALAACDGTPEATPTASPPTSTRSASAAPGAFTAPPLRLPSGGRGEDCPVSRARPWSEPGRANRVLGPGPVYPIADYFPDAALPLRDQDRHPDGSYTVKVRWLASGYTGPVLVRAGRIDGPGTAAVEFSYTGEPRDGGHYAELTDPDTDLPATTTVGGPGCYAYQVDGTTFSETIVFRTLTVVTPVSS